MPINDFTSVRITSNTPTMITTALSGVRQAKQLATQFWSVEAEFRPLSFSEAKKIQGFLSLQRGSLYDFNIVFPGISDASGGIRLVKAAYPGTLSKVSTLTGYPIGTSSIAINSRYTGTQYTAAGAENIFQAGDYIKFANHSKVYQVVNDIVFDSNGDGIMNIFPNLMAAVIGDEEITYESVPFKMYSSQTAQDTGFVIGDEVSMTLQLQESL